MLLPISHLRAEEPAPAAQPEDDEPSLTAPQVHVQEESRPVFDPEEYDRNHPKAGVSKVQPADQFFVNLRKRNQKFADDQKKRRRDFVTWIRKQELTSEERSREVRDFNRSMREREAEHQKEVSESLAKRQKALTKFYEEQKKRKREFLEDLKKAGLSAEEQSRKLSEFQRKEKERETKMLEVVAKGGLWNFLGLPDIQGQDD